MSLSSSNIPIDILVILCSMQPILGLTCKKLNNICPKKPPGTTYNKESDYDEVIEYTPPNFHIKNTVYYYYRFNINYFNGLIESDKYRTLNITCGKDTYELGLFFTHIANNLHKYNQFIDRFKYKNELQNTINAHSNGNKLFTHLNNIDSIATAFLMYLYH